MGEVWKAEDTKLARTVALKFVPRRLAADAAALEAVAGVRPNSDRSRRLGVIVCLQSGCVQFSYRFFDETLKDPTTASPLLFPETVFAAPASHVAALLENAPPRQVTIGTPAHKASTPVEWEL